MGILYVSIIILAQTAFLWRCGAQPWRSLVVSAILTLVAYTVADVDGVLVGVFLLCGMVAIVRLATAIRSSWFL